jgi:hypothetical protein
MIGLQKLIIEKDIKLTNLAGELNVTTSALKLWFNKQKIPDKYLNKLSEIFKVEETYFNKIVGNEVFNRRHKGFNEYKINGDTTIVYVYYKQKTKMECLIDTEDLQKLIDFDRHWSACWFKNVKDYYVVCMDYNEKYNNKSHSQQIFMHRFVLDANDEFGVDHKFHNGLDNRKSNLRIIDKSKNASNRKGANRNSSTGVRNVNYGANRGEYWVQFQKKDKRYKWVFPLDMFDEACKFAEKKRKEIFGDYAGLG